MILKKYKIYPGVSFKRNDELAKNPSDSNYDCKKCIIKSGCGFISPSCIVVSSGDDECDEETNREYTYYVTYIDKEKWKWKKIELK